MARKKAKSFPPTRRPVALLFFLPHSPLPRAPCFAVRGDQDGPRPHVDALPDKDVPRASSAMFAALEAFTQEPDAYSEFYSDEELAELERIQFTFAFKPLVTLATLREAFERDGYAVSELTKKGGDARVIGDVTRHVAMTSRAAVLACIFEKTCDKLPYHASAAATVIAPALRSAPARARRFAAQLVEASEAWSPAMRDAFVAIVAHSVLLPMMKEGPHDARATAATRELLSAFPSTSTSVRRHVLEWQRWCETTLDVALGALAKVRADKPVPATAAQLSELAKAVGRVPADLAQLYRFAGNLDRVAMGGPGEWLDVADIGRAYALNRECTMPANLIPIETDGAGNYSCLERGTGKIMDWDHETREATPITSTLAWHLTTRVIRPLRAAAAETRTKK